MSTKQNKIAIVYDWIDSWGGVERILLELHSMFPSAHFYSSVYDPRKAVWAKELQITTSFIDRLPQFIKKSRIACLPLYPYAFESFDFSSYHTVISVTSAFAKALITKPNTRHFCYLLTPPRYLWNMTDKYIPSSILKLCTQPLIESLRTFDRISAQRPDVMAFISQTVKDRAEKVYGISGDVIYPPFDIEYWKNISKSIKIYLPKSYYLIVSRLESYKRIELAINTFNMRPESQLVIVGTGRLKDALKQQSGNNIHFIDAISDSDLGYVYTHAKALLMPQEEDFGYVSLEAQFQGCPVIAYRKGGAIETISEGETGFFFDEQSVRSLLAALERFENVTYNVNKNQMQLWVGNFAKERFKAAFFTRLQEF